MSELPTAILIDLSRDLNDRVHNQIMLKIGIVDDPKDKFKVSLGALSAALGAVGGIFSAAYGMPKSSDLGRQLALEILELGEKAKSMTEAEWASFVKKSRAPR